MPDMGLKLHWYFCLLMETPLGIYFQVLSPYSKAIQCNKNTHFCFLKVTGQGHSKGSIMFSFYLGFLHLKVVSTTYGPIITFKTFITQIYLFVVPSNILRFPYLYRFCLAHFKPRDNPGKHSFEKQYCRNYFDDIY